MKRSSIIGIFLGSLVALNCNDAGVDTSVMSGTYSYIGYAGKSLRIVQRGWLRLDVSDSSNVAGAWQFNNQDLQQLEGQFSEGKLTLNLNPRFVDNNLFLVGVMEGRKYSGNWSQVGFPGVMAEGTFVAERK